MMFYREHKRVSMTFDPEKDRAKQEFRDDADINMIVKRFGPRDLLELSGNRLPLFEDFSQVEDYQTAMEMSAAAMEAFGELPAAVRAAHDNDPQKFLDWFDQASVDDLKEAGLVVSDLPKANPAPAEPVSGASGAASEPPVEASGDTST